VGEERKEPPRRGNVGQSLIGHERRDNRQGHPGGESREKRRDWRRFGEERVWDLKHGGWEKGRSIEEGGWCFRKLPERNQNRRGVPPDFEGKSCSAWEENRKEKKWAIGRQPNGGLLIKKTGAPKNKRIANRKNGNWGIDKTKWKSPVERGWGKMSKERGETRSFGVALEESPSHLGGKDLVETKTLTRKPFGSTGQKYLERGSNQRVKVVQKPETPSQRVSG